MKYKSKHWVSKTKDGERVYLEPKLKARHINKSDMIFGSLYCIVGFYWLARSMFKAGSEAYDECEYEALKKIGCID